MAFTERTSAATSAAVRRPTPTPAISSSAHQVRSPSRQVTGRRGLGDSSHHPRHRRDRGAAPRTRPDRSRPASTEVSASSDVDGRSVDCTPSRLLRAAGGPRFAVYGLENDAGTPIYVHAKVCLIDDTWGSVGSDNANRRSWTHGSELSCAVLGHRHRHRHGRPRGPFVGTVAAAPARGRAPRRRGLRAGPHRSRRCLRRLPGRGYATGLLARRGRSRAAPPPASFAPTPQPTLSRWTRAWATPMYRLLYDPDGRTARMRRQRRF